MRSFWEANYHSASQIPHLVWDPRVHYCVRKNPPLVFVLNQADPAHNQTCYFFIFPSLRLCQVFSLFCVFRVKSCIHFRSLPCALHIHTQPIFLDWIIIIIFGEEYKLWISPILSLPASKIQIFPTSPYSQILSTYFCLSMTKFHIHTKQ
jgi:hypothetical protein